MAQVIYPRKLFRLALTFASHYCLYSTRPTLSKPMTGLSWPRPVNSQRKLKFPSLRRPGPAKAMLGQAGLGWPKQDIFLHGSDHLHSIKMADRFKPPSMYTRDSKFSSKNANLSSPAHSKKWRRPRKWTFTPLGR